MFLRWLLLPLVCVMAAEELVPGLGYYWVPKDLNNTVNAEFRWDEAMSRCWYEGGHLVVLNSQAEADAVVEIMKKNGIDGYAFAGFSDVMKEGYYITVTDEPLKNAGYSGWANGFPNGGTTTNCGAINARGELLDIGCRQILPLVCERQIWTGYDLSPGLGYYKIYNDPSTWGEALQKCHQEGAKLLVLNSEPEAIVVARLFKDAGVELAHVGLQDQYREAFYYSVNGEEISATGYNRWVLGEPHKDSLHNYVALDDQGLYHMVNATIQLPFACEHAL